MSVGLVLHCKKCGGNIPPNLVGQLCVSAWPCPFSDIIEHNGSYSL